MILLKIIEIRAVCQLKLERMSGNSIQFFCLTVIFGYIFRFFFTSDGYRISARISLEQYRDVISTISRFSRPGISMEASSLRKFFLASPSVPTFFLRKNSWFPALKFLHSFSVHGAAKRSGAFQYLRSILCQLLRSPFSSDVSLAGPETRH